MFRSALAALIPLLMLTASPAEAGTPGCVGDGEFRSIERGMTMARVHEIFETNGWFFSRQGDVITRQYNACPNSEVNNRYVLYRERADGKRVIDKI